MNLEEVILKRIRQTLAPPEPLPIFVAEIRYPEHAWYELTHLSDMTPEELARYLLSHFTLEQQAQAMKMLEKARRNVESPCGQRLVVLFRRDDTGALDLDDVRFMDPVDFAGFMMHSGREKTTVGHQAASPSEETRKQPAEDESQTFSMTI